MKNITVLLVSLLYVLVSLEGVLSSEKYCIDNETLYVEKTYYKVKNGVETSYKFNDTEVCDYGCYNETFSDNASCNFSPPVNILIFIIITIVIFLVIYVVLKLASVI